MNYSVLTVISFLLLSSNFTFGQILDWPDCDPNVVTWHSHPFSCTKYVLCFHGNPIERLCAPGLHFSREFEQCMFPQLAKCDDNDKCPEVDDTLNPVFLPNPEDCGAYFVCFEGSPIARECAETLWWDVVYNWCTTGDEVVCDSRVPNNPNPPVTLPPPTNEPTTVPPTLPPTTNAPTTVPPTTTPDPNTMDCPLGSEPSFHPHSRSCSLYFICINGVAFLRECAVGTIFDILERKCYDEEFATCISGTEGDVDTKPAVFDSSSTYFECPLQLAGTIALYPHQSRCESYYLCNKGIAYLKDCEPGQLFDFEKLDCWDESDAQCLNFL